MSAAYRCRASGFAGLFDCAYRWEGQHLLGLRGKNSVAALIGTAVHAGTAAYDQARITGDAGDVMDTAQVALTAMRQREADEGCTWETTDPTRREAERIVVSVHTKYCRDIAPQFHYVAVEMETKPLEIDCGGGVVVQLTGTLDRMRLRESDGKRGINDVKTGARAVQNGRATTGKHRAQLGIYELLAEHSTGQAIELPAAVSGINTTGAHDAATSETEGCRELLLGRGGEADPPGLLEYAAKMLRDGLFPPNTQSALCSPRYCVRWNSCPYRER